MFRVLFLYEHKHTGRFANLHYCTFNTNEISAHKRHSRVRSSHQRCTLKSGVLKNFAKFRGKHLCQSLFFHKVAALRPATLLKRDSGTDVIFKTTFFTELLRTTTSAVPIGTDVIFKNTFFTELLRTTTSAVPIFCI